VDLGINVGEIPNAVESGCQDVFAVHFCAILDNIFAWRLIIS
jgi:hypothetical protein